MKKINREDFETRIAEALRLIDKITSLIDEVFESAEQEEHKQAA